MTTARRLALLLAHIGIWTACGDDGASVGADAGSDGDGDCVAVSGAGTEPWFDMVIDGSGFDAHEGKRIRVVVTLNPPDIGRFSVADAEITGGAFTLQVPQTLNHGYYTGVGLYVDDDGNDRCDPGEPMWDYTTPGVLDDIRTEITAGGLLPFRPPAAACTINGFFDLAAHLPCPP